MKVETADYLAKARATLADARKIATLPLPHIAARETYLARFTRPGLTFSSTPTRPQEPTAGSGRVRAAGES